MKVIELRKMDAQDIPILDPILQAAYGNPTSFAPRLSRFLSLGPGDWFVAEHQGRIAGSGGLNVMGRTAYVGVVAVDPALHRRGIAMAIMERLLAHADSRGCSTLLLDASDAGRPLYERLGFVADDFVDQWKRLPEAAPPPGAPFPATVALATIESRNLSLGLPPAFLPAELACLDRELWGEDRSRFLEAYVPDDPALAAMARAPGGSLLGYCLVQAGPGILGPLVARDSGAAAALLDWALSTRPAKGALTAMIPTANGEAARLLSGVGFALSKRLAHMRLGPPLAQGRRLAVYGQFNFALG